MCLGWSSSARMCSGSSSRSTSPPPRPLPRRTTPLHRTHPLRHHPGGGPRAVSTSSQRRTRRWRATSASPAPTTISGRWPCLEKPIQWVWATMKSIGKVEDVTKVYTLCLVLLNQIG